MGLTFLAPLVLAGLVAVGIPVVIHLTHRERRDPVVFPSLMFLRRVPFREARRQRIRNWLLFILRTAAVVLLVTAFARPLWERGAGTASSRAARDLIILADRSYSMGYQARWARAQDAIRAAIDGLAPEDRATLVLFDDRAEVLNAPTPDRAALTALVDAARPGSGATRFAPALQLARDLLDDPGRRREVLLISDYQRIGWQERADIHLPAGTLLTGVNVAAGPAANLAVVGAAFTRGRRAGRREVSVTARVVRAGEGSGVVPVTLELDGLPLQTVRVAVDTVAGAAVRFAPIPEPTRVARARIVIPQDALPHDDAVHLVLEPTPVVRVLLITAPDAPAAEQIYLERALAVAVNPGFPVTTRRATQVTARDIEQADAVILHDAPLPSGDTGRRLRAFLAAGGGVFISMGPRSGALPREFADSVTGAGAIADRLADGGAVVSPAGYDHPVFAPFSRPRSGDFAAARVFRYRALTPAPTATVLARFDDGTAAMVAGRYGSGRVLVWASGLANRWNDLPLQPVFVPLIHQMTRFLADYRDRPAAHEAGGVIDLGRTGIALDAALVVEAPDGGRIPLAPGATRQVDFQDAGFYVVRPLADRSRVMATFAVNSDPVESDLASMDPEELNAAVAPSADSAASRPGAASGASPDVLERRQTLWWYFLFGVLLLMAAETVVAFRARA